MPERLSMDEFSKEKGKRKFVTVISDLDKSSLLEVINSHKSEEIIEELEKISLFCHSPKSLTIYKSCNSYPASDRRLISQ